MIFYNLVYKITCKLSPTKAIPDNPEIPAAIGIKGNVEGLHMTDVTVEGMRLMDVDAQANLKDVRMKRVKVALLPSPQHAPTWLRFLVDGTGFVASVITVVPLVRLLSHLFGAY